MSVCVCVSAVYPTTPPPPSRLLMYLPHTKVVMRKVDRAETDTFISLTAADVAAFLSSFGHISPYRRRRRGWAQSEAPLGASHHAPQNGGKGRPWRRQIGGRRDAGEGGRMTCKTDRERKLKWDRGRERDRGRGETKEELDGRVSELCGLRLHGRFSPIIYKR